MASTAAQTKLGRIGSAPVLIDARTDGRWNWVTGDRAVLVCGMAWPGLGECTAYPRPGQDSPP